MSRVREKKIKKLKKAHVWPAVLFIFISLLMTVAACGILIVVILQYFASDRLQTSHENIKNISSMFSGSSDIDEMQRVLNYLEKETDYSDAIYILDENNEIITGYGEATYDLNRIESLPLIEGDQEVYFDTGTVNGIVNPEGDIDGMKVIAWIFRGSPSEWASSMRENILSLHSWAAKKVLFEDNFWYGALLPGTGKLLIKCTLDIYTSDLIIVLIICIAVLIIICLPLLFMFINVLMLVSRQKRMTKLLYTDQTTYGKNWLYFEENAEKILCSKKSSGRLYAMVDIALMKYRNFCTYHGVDAGEDLLEKIDNYLTQHISKKTELSAHNGRASFALLLLCTDMGSGQQRVETLLNEITNQFGHVGIAYHAGVCFIEPLKSADGRKNIRRKFIDIDDVYNCANAARSSIPEDNPMAMAVFDKKMLDERLWEHKVEEKMQAALDNEEFIVYIQPKYNPVTEKLAGAEALVRWINQEEGFVPPGRFIPIFEKNGFITKLDDYMISHVAKLQAQWISEGKSVVPVSVNVSRAHFANANLAEHICNLVDEYNTPHNLIEIELTESAFFDDKQALLRTVRKLQECGFEVSMDDFGAGYSSLNSLKDLPLDVLKLDADFFRGEDGGDRGEIVVAEAIALAKKLNMRIVAEGIEKKEQVDFLAEQDCDMIQGYYFAKPMPANEYSERLEQAAEPQ